MKRKSHLRKRSKKKLLVELGVRVHQRIRCCCVSFKNNPVVVVVVVDRQFIIMVDHQMDHHHRALCLLHK